DRAAAEPARRGVLVGRAAGRMSTRESRAIARNTTLQIGAHALAVLLAVAAEAVMTRYLGVRAYGALSLLTVLLTLPVAAVTGSLDTLAVRRLASDRDENGAFFRNVLGVKVATASLL